MRCIFHSTTRSECRVETTCLLVQVVKSFFFPLDRRRHTQCVARLFVRVAYVGSLLIERGIHSV